MSLLGKAAVAMWWNIRPEQRADLAIGIRTNTFRKG